ncbi:MAG: hypothetical protein J6R82_04165 [Clostridia bacterium]|nr:hypothetical protein [Clostridia bacterium]
MKRRFSTLSLSITLAALLLLSACNTPASDPTTTPPATTTTEPTPSQPKKVSYRPDLAWCISGFVFANDGIDIANPIAQVGPGKTLIDSQDEARYPYLVHLSFNYPTEGERSDAACLMPTEYLRSLGWEILPADAYDHVYNADKHATLAVATAAQIEALETSQLLAYYGIELQPDQTVLHLVHAIQLPEGIDDPMWDVNEAVHIEK